MDKSDISIDDEIEISTQSYLPKSRINGVEFFKTNRFKDDGGSFLELARIGSNGQVFLSGFDVPNFQIKQINHSYIEPGVIKAWHLHFNQEDLWFVPPRSRLLVGLCDIRKDSPTLGSEMRFVMGDGDAQVLLIPRGVAHGCSNPYNVGTQLMYMVNQEFDVINPDEQRLPYDALVGKDFWQIQKG